jgi:glycosyltransferase involved in cell wall biosynthesis
MGGTEVHAETLAKAAAAKGHAVTMITTAHPAGTESEKNNGYETVYLPGTHFSMSRKWLGAWWEKSAKKISELAAAGRVDVIWAENFAGQHYAGLPEGPGKKPVISIINGPGLRGELLNHWAQVSSPLDLVYFLTRATGQMLFYTLPWFYNATGNSDYLICVSDYCEREIRREFSKSRQKIATIYNPVNAALFCPEEGVRAAGRKRYGISAGEPVLAMSGVMSRQKGMHLGLMAFRLVKDKVPAARLLIAGDGPEMQNLKALAASQGLAESALFLGRLENKDINTFCNAADIYLNPTLRHEGLPLTLLEAISCGLPCVTAKVGGTESAIEDGISGFFTKPGDFMKMAEKAALLLQNPSLREEMGKSARRRAVEVFNPDKIISQYLETSEKTILGLKP